MHLFRANAVRHAALLLLAALTLAGCLTSKRPLFDEATAVAALGDGGRYQTFEVTDSGGYKREEKMTVRRAGKGYEFTDSRGVATNVSFYPLSDGRFAGQVLSGGGDYAYVMARMADGAVYMHAAECDKQDKAKLAALGVVFHDSECRLDNVTDPRALFAALDFGAPASKMEPIGGRRRSRR